MASTMAGGFEIVFSPSGKRIATSSYRPAEVTVWEVDTGRLVFHAACERGAVAHLSFPTERHLCYSRTVFDLDAGRELATLGHEVEGVHGLHGAGAAAWLVHCVGHSPAQAPTGLVFVPGVTAVDLGAASLLLLDHELRVLGALDGAPGRPSLDHVLVAASAPVVAWERSDSVYVWDLPASPPWAAKPRCVLEEIGELLPTDLATYDVSEAQVSADGATVAIQTSGGLVLVPTREDGRRALLLPDSNAARKLVVDGSWIAASWKPRRGYERLRVWHARTGELLVDLPSPGSRFGIHEGRALVAFAAGGANLDLYDTRGTLVGLLG